jgi:hypothetical protein
MIAAHASNTAAHKSVISQSLKSLIRPLLPPILLNGYRRGRYGSGHRDLEAAYQRARDAQFFLPSRSLIELFPGIEPVNVTVPVTEINRPQDMVVPLAELLTLGAVCRHLRPRRIFEIGTYTGSSTLVMAMNTPDATELITLDSDTSEIVGSAYRSAPHASKIRQLHGDSRVYDYAPYLSDIDLILVDANHTYEFVEADTDTAFRLLRPGGVIVWDDYRWLDIHWECRGVTFYLNELQRSRPIFHITGTRFAIYLNDAPGVYEKA